MCKQKSFVYSKVFWASSDPPPWSAIGNRKYRFDKRPEGELTTRIWVMGIMVASKLIAWADTFCREEAH